MANEKKMAGNIVVDAEALMMMFDRYKQSGQQNDDESNIAAPKRKRRTREEIEADFINGMPKQYLEVKSNGLPKAKAAEAIRSYDDFKAIQDYFLSKHRIRDYAMWTIGVSFGVRISDLVTLRFCHLLKEDYSFRDRVFVYEKKTSKLNKLLITESVKQAMTILLNEFGGKPALSDFIFQSSRGGAAIDTRSAHRILKEAQKKLGLPINIGSHTMRKSYGDIGVCVSKYRIDPTRFEAISRRYNHSDAKYTMMYLGVYQKMEDEIQNEISEFLLGHSDVNELFVAETHSIDDVLNKIDDVLDAIKKTEEA